MRIGPKADLSELDKYTSPLDEVDEDSDYRFELPAAGAGEILLTDDDESAAALNRAILEAAGYNATYFATPSELLAALKVDVPQVIVTDFDMPEMSGLDLARRAQEIEPDVKVILLTGSGDESTAQAALRMGVSDYIKKPPEPVALARSVQRAFHQTAAEQHHRAMVHWMKVELDRRADALREITVSTLAALANALDLRSPHFHGHSRAVAMQSAAIAEAMGMNDDEIEAVRTAGMLHDVGMMAVPDALVEKESALTEDEFEVIRSHCDRGVEILRPMKHLGPTVRYIHEHHERLNGSGYPEGKKGDEISLGGQIVGIAEAWIAILESRAYRNGLSREEGLEMLMELQGQWFSQEVTDALQRADIGVI
jgi:putative two-component system response regulator